MNGIQKMVVALGLIALGLAAAMAPYRVTYDVRTLGPVELSVTAPAWSPPSRNRGELVRRMPLPNYSTVRSVELETGKLGLVWGAIALVTLALAALTATRKGS